jgi:hypothetical protein
MTIEVILASAVRFWWAVVIGALVTASAAAWVWTKPGIYWAQVDVYFLAPATAPNLPNNLTSVSPRIIQLASVIQRQVTGGGGSASVVSSTVTLKDEGVRAGTTVELPESGGQWTVSFDRALLRVDAVDSSPAKVEARVQQAVGEIRAALDSRQREAGVGPQSTIVTQLSPDTPVVHYEEGLRRRALVGVFALGVGMTGAAVVMLGARGIRRTTPST